MVKEKNYLINEAAKEVHVETHVLRYWEEELSLPIKRNEQGHRIYTQEDIDKFITIKKLKDQGLQLKAVKMVLETDTGEAGEDMKADNPFAQKQLTKINRNGEVKVIKLNPSETNNWKEHHMIEVKEKKVTPAEKQQIAIKMKESAKMLEKQQEKTARMQYLIQKMIREAVEDNNEKLITQISDHVRDDMCKELDYQFRLLEERDHTKEEERRKLDEEHCRKLDELLRLYSSKSSEKERRHEKKLGNKNMKENEHLQKKDLQKKDFRFWRRAEVK